MNHNWVAPQTASATPGNILTMVQFDGFHSHGFFRGSVRFYGDMESTQLFSSAESDADVQWQEQRERLAMNEIIRRAIMAEDAIRIYNYAH